MLDPPEPDIFELSKTDVDVRGAYLFALLAYPERRNLKKRHKAILRLSAVAAPNQTHSVVDPEGRVVPVDMRFINNGEKQYEGRMRRRLVAGRVALQAVFAFEAGEPPGYFNGRRWGLTGALRQQVEAKPDMDAASNLHRRVWLPSIPVIHIAMGWIAVTIDYQRQMGHLPDMIAFLQNPPLVDAAVQRSLGFEQLITDCPTLKFTAANLIKLR